MCIRDRFIIRQITEKCYKHGTDLYTLSVDFRQAFDSVRRVKLSEAMRNMGIPSDLIRLTKVPMRHTNGKIKYKNMLSESIIFQYGVKQGDGLFS